MNKLLSIILICCAFNLSAQQIKKGKETNFYTSGSINLTAGSMQVIDFANTDEYVNAATVWNCTDGFLNIEIITALGIIGNHTCPPKSSIDLTISSDRFDTFNILAFGSGSIVVNGVRDNRMVKEAQGVYTAISSANCDDQTTAGPVIRTVQQNSIREEVEAGSYTLAANSYYYYVRNAGFIAITVNGETVSPNGVYQCGNEYDYEYSKQDFCEQVDFVVPPGGHAWYRVAYPSN